MTFYELDTALADQHQKLLAQEARRARLVTRTRAVRSPLAAALRRLAAALDPAPVSQPWTA